MIYHKIPTVYLRDPATKYRNLLEGQWATPELAYLAGNRWAFTEKVDGTNIRVIWDPSGGLRFGGKTDKAQIPPFLLDALKARFTPDLMATFTDPIILYGEGYGAKIQKGGGNYLSDRCDFILFDVWCGMWLKREDVLDIAQKLRCPIVPITGYGTLHDAIDLVKGGLSSMLGEMNAEGLVMRPVVELAGRRGERVIAKVKTKDFIHAAGKG